MDVIVTAALAAAIASAVAFFIFLLADTHWGAKTTQRGKITRVDPAMGPDGRIGTQYCVVLKGEQALVEDDADDPPLAVGTEVDVVVSKGRWTGRSRALEVRAAPAAPAKTTKKRH